MPIVNAETAYPDTRPRSILRPQDACPQLRCNFTEVRSEVPAQAKSHTKVLPSLPQSEAVTKALHQESRGPSGPSVRPQVGQRGSHASRRTPPPLPPKDRLPPLVAHTATHLCDEDTLLYDLASSARTLSSSLRGLSPLIQLARPQSPSVPL